MSSQTATVANVTAATSSVPVFPQVWAAESGPSNGRVVYNDSTATLYLLFGTGATTTNYTVQIAAGGYFEFPAPLYCGEADGVWSSANGYARTTAW